VFWGTAISLLLLIGVIDNSAVQTILAIPVVLAIAVGYPLLVVFSLPKLFAPPPIRRAAIGGAAAILMNIAVNVIVPPNATSAVGIAAGILGAGGWLTVVSVATAAVGNAQRHLQIYKPLDCLNTWFCLLTFPVLGVFFLHKAISSLFRALASEQGAGTRGIASSV
jgi:hypothetical protein